MQRTFRSSVVRRVALRRALTVLVSAALVGAGVLAEAPTALAATPSATISVTPTTVLNGALVGATGKATTAKVRPVRLQRAVAGSKTFSTVAKGSTKSTGSYALSDSVSRTGSYRVYLPATTVKGTKLAAITSTAVPVTPASVLPNGQTLDSGQSLVAPDGSYTLTMRSDGNLVLVAASSPSTVEWSTGTSAAGARLVMQLRGDLVLVDPNGVLLWDTGSADPTAYLSLGNRGALGVYAGNGSKLWGRKSGLVKGDSTAAVRGQSWVDAKVKYSQSKYFTNTFGTYRTDCSGFVSMMWALRSSYTTRTIPSISTVITKSQLQPGDVLNAYNYHVVMFDGWANAQQTKYWVYEETPSTGAAHHVIPYPYWSSSSKHSFVPRRLTPTTATSSAKSLAMQPYAKAPRSTGGGDAGPTGHATSYAK